MDLVQLKEKCGENGFELNETQLFQFEQYIKLLQEWNEKINLTAITEYSEIVEKHFFDSVIPLFDKKICGKLCDVGSGAGFPSIPMKIVDPSIEVVIIEPLGKRCKFLNEVIKILGLEKIQIINERSEDYVKVARESFDVVIARAVASLSMLSELCIPHVKKGGLFIAMKGDKGLEELESAKKAVKTLGCEILNIEEYNLGESKRINLIYKKIVNTPIKYPRQFAKIKKNPL